MNGPLYLYGTMEEDLKVMIGYLVNVCKRNYLNMNLGNIKVIMLVEWRGRDHISM